MNVTINKGKAHGTIIAPPSKSVAHRMLICGGLANAKSTITGIRISSGDRPHPEVRREGREPLADKAGESTHRSRSEGEKGLR